MFVPTEGRLKQALIVVFRAGSTAGAYGSQ